ncbi:cytochrome P450 2C5-like isoform X1 [Falco biarmicus]|uniref:cytochrome P450 2C5-like isoform X1 n=1 Tax=Falco peregrinus TaxID=8954 RepID=UPI000387170D|nr:cytochrome P450 2C5-like isoform X1 [Falco peregrinus]XP_037265507.1 cytochrome P450 2C5-like isoform X1 [Falco rusticolus]XP_055579001.1 cytochrome P450 2C5-like isoform X1 [Falco cherrug]XP_056191386.1 cytochrome P450 2C5-like isoform X1 [Falco biarmicus]
MDAGSAGMLVTLLLLSILWFLIWKVSMKRSQLPPGPAPWPILGNLWQKDVLPLYRTYEKLSSTYGPIFTVWLGLKPVVVLCGYETVKDALLGHAEEFGGRPEIPLLRQLSKDYGFVSNNEKKWQELRRFTLSTLRDFGMGKSSMSQRVQQETQHLVKLLAELKGNAFEPLTLFRHAVANVICSVVFGNHYSYSDTAFLELLNVIGNYISFFLSPIAAVYNTFPNIMHHLPGPHRKVLARCEKLKDYIRERVELHKLTLDPSCPRDYIDCFLIKAEKEKNSPENMYSHEDLVMSVFNLFGAGTVTTSNSLVFCLLILAKYPHIQAKVQEEIDAVVGAARAPSTEDKLKMPYTNAVIHELQRLQKSRIENFPRMTTQDIVFRGHTIPKGMVVIPVLSSVHTDPTQWENPKEVDPGHFLDEKGEFRKHKAFMAFSAGKRMCPGEALARIELFLFLTTLLQSFTFQLASKYEETDLLSLWLKIESRAIPCKFFAIRRPVSS